MALSVTIFQGATAFTLIILHFGNTSCDDNGACAVFYRTFSCERNGTSLSRVPNSIPQNVTEVRITGHKIPFINDTDFHELFQLSILILRENGITLIEEGSFQDLTNLRHLDLLKNSLKVITPDVFRGVENLQWLSVSANQELVMESCSLSKLQHLRSFGAFNTRVNFTKALFVGQGCMEGNIYSPLRYINIPYSDTSSFDTAFFSQFEELSFLGIGGRTVETDLSNITKLSLLPLGDLRLFGFPRFFFTKYTIQPLKNLYSLTLASSNPVKLNVFPRSFLQHDSFNGSLNFKFALFTHLPKYAFSNVSSVRVIDLSSGALRTIHRDAFKFLRNLVSLRLDRNQLHELPYCTFNDGMAELAVLWLANNPWSCNCSFEWLVNFFKGRRHLEFSGQCNGPEDKNGIDFWNLTTDSFSCEGFRLSNASDDTNELCPVLDETGTIRSSTLNTEVSYTNITLIFEGYSGSHTAPSLSIISTSHIDGTSSTTEKGSSPFADLHYGSRSEVKWKVLLTLILVIFACTLGSICSYKYLSALKSRSRVGSERQKMTSLDSIVSP